MSVRRQSTSPSPSTSASGDPEPAAPRKGLAHRLYHGETAIDFMAQRRRWFIVSGLVILIGLIALFTQGLNFGIDFTGGTAWELKSDLVSVGQVENVLAPFGLRDAQIEVLSGGTGRVIRVQADVEGETAATTAKKTQVRDALAKLGNTTGDQVAFTDVGPSWGREISRKAIRALVFFFIVIAAYISLRFEWKMAVAGLLAVVHDILVTVGVYAVTGFSVTPGTVIAFLTILGYSLYDTIVVFDRVEENAKGLGASGRMTYSDIVNLSMNQVLMRSLNTSFVAILPVLSVLVLGAYVFDAATLEDFGLALTVGLLTGAYSSVFIASPALGMLKEREPRYAAIRARLAQRAHAGGLSPAAAAAAAGAGAAEPVLVGGGRVADDGPPLRPAAAGGGGSGAARPGASRPAGRPGGGNRPAPRPRKKGRKR